MTYLSEQRWQRVLALVLTLMMLLTGVTVPAQAEDWQSLSVILSWTDGAGNPVSATAVPVAWSEDQAYWVRVTPEAMAQGMTLSVTDPAGQYTYSTPTGDVLTGVFDAGTTIDGTILPVEITAYDGAGNAVAVYHLYVSTQADTPEEVKPEPARADVQVIYQAVDGTVLGSTTQTCVEDQANEVYAIDIDGYTLATDMSASVQTVTVNADGTASPNPVVFYYNAIPKEPARVDVQVIYQAVDGTVLSSTTQTCVEDQANEVYAIEIDGYTLATDMSASVQTVTVNADGTANPNPVVFYYNAIPKEPARVDVQVIYQAVDGTVLGNATQTCVEGQSNEVYAIEIDGYTLATDMSASVQTVTVNADGTASPNPVVFYYNAIPKEPAKVDVQVIYQAVDGTVLGSTTQTCVEDQTNEVYAIEIDGYTLATDMSASVQTVTINADGTASPNPVVFYYNAIPKEPAKVDVQVIYQAVDGTVLGNSTQTCVEGQSNEVYAIDIDGYTLATDMSASVQTVTVNADGTASPNPVVFYYNAIPKEPARVDVQVIYQAVDGTVLGNTTQTCVEDQANEVYAIDIDGYTLATDMSASVQTVTVNADGTASPNPVVFYYNAIPKEPAKVDVQVIYQAVDGAVLGSATQTCVEGQTNEVYAVEIDGYVLASNMSPAVQTVTVNADGTASPNPVVFYYNAIPKEAVKVDVQVIYQFAADGITLGSATQTCVEGQTNEVYAVEIDGYVLASNMSPAVQTVTVNSDGTASPNPVVFYYNAVQQAPDPVSATVTVSYVGEDGREVAPTDTVTYTADGTYTLSAAQAGVDGNLLELISADEVTVNVTGGVADPAQVRFVYREKQQPAEPVPATISVYYRNQDGQNIASAQSVTLPGGQITAVAPDASLVPEGYDASSAQPVTVTVTAEGVATPAEVVFTFAKAVVEEPDIPVPQGEMINRFGTITGNKVAVRTSMDASGNSNLENRLAKGTVVYLLREELNEQGESWTRVLIDGQQYFIMTQFLQMMTKAESDAYMAANYAEPIPPLTEADLTGGAEPEPEPEPEPVTVDVPVIYVTEAGVELDRQTTPASSAQPVIITPTSGKVEGYILISASSVQVTVDADTGAANPAEVRFTYREPAPEVKTTQVKVAYVTEDGQELDSQIINCSSDKTTTVTPNSSKADGYILTSASSVQVTVDAATGAATPAEVRFTYREPEPEIRTAQVTVLYITEDGQELDRQTITCASDKTTTITPTSGKTEGYALVSAGSVEITVDQQTGAASQSEVRFTYRVLPPATVTVDVPVIYVTEDGVELDRQTIQCTSAVATTVMPTSSKVAGYTLVSASSVQVTVDVSTGAANPSEVRFTYARPAQYEGYALTSQAVALRTEISTSDNSIIRVMDKDTLVYVYGQQYDGSNQAWSSVSTLDEQPGMVPDSALNRITNEVAQYYISLWEEQNKPEDTPAPTATPPQVAGTAVTIGDGVLFRQTYDSTGAIIAVLPKDTEVEVLGQAYTMNGEAWHSVRYSGNLGYIRADMLRFVTNTDAPATVQPTVNPDGLSAYGYVSSSTVNFRQSASTSSTRLRVLKKYAMCLVLGTEQVGDTTWYHVKYDGQEGYIAGNYFKHMTISEVNTFLNSDEYRQGVLNNSTANNNQDNTGSYVGGGVVSEEDKKVDEWTNPNSGLNVSYEPFNPFATPEPIVTETPDPSASAEPSESPEATATLEMLPTIDINDPGENEGGGSAVGWIIAIVILALGGGGVYAYVLYTQNKRKAAQRAAQRRAQAAQQQRANAQQRPGQPGQPNQPRTGTYTNQAGAARPTGYPQPQARKPYAPGQSAYQRPAGQTPAAGQQPQQGASAYQRPAGQTPVSGDTTVRPGGAYTSATPGSDETIRPAQPGSQSSPYSRPMGSYTGSYQSSQPSAGADETIRPVRSAADGQSSPYSRPAETSVPGSFTASYRPDAPATTPRQGRRYRSQQNGAGRPADENGAEKPITRPADNDDFKSDNNTDDFS